MLKQNKALKRTSLVVIGLFSAFIINNAQYIISNQQKLPYKNDSVLLHIDKSIRGDIQWEASKDNNNWISLTGKNNDTLLIKVDSSAYYRAKITEGTCDPLFSDVVLVAQLFDDRDKQFYDIVKIGNQWWMAENLNYKNPQGSSYYNNDSIGYSQYGRIYKWSAAANSCPSGWHLPSDAEWKMLETTIGINSESVNETGWRGTNQAFSLFNNGARNFDILFGGQLYPSNYYGDEGVIATFWTTDQIDENSAWYRGFNITHGDIHRDSYTKDYGYSVRCIRNSNPFFSLDSVGFVSDSSGIVFVSIIYDGGLIINEKGVCWSQSENPDTSTNHMSIEGGSDSFVKAIYPLAEKTNYFVRAYLKTNEGIRYSNQISFTTKVKLPQVITSSVSSVNTNSATCGGNIVGGNDISVLTRGVCWDISKLPTINDNKTVNGSGTGSYSSSISGLMPNTKYYVRAYATVDGGIAYGNEFSFTTLPLNEIGSIVDTRDGKLYQTVRIGNQWWMAENLKFFRSSGSWFYEGDSLTFAHYGRLYNWQTANTSCPIGWHLPGDAEWKTLESTLGMHVTDIENTEWRGTDQALALFVGGSTGFNVKFGGMRYIPDNYVTEGTIAAFWTSGQFDTDNAWYRGFNTSHSDIHRNYYSKEDGYSVRCLKNMAAEIVIDSIGQISEYTGNVYVNIKYDGGSSITERGVCWSTDVTPVYSGNHLSSGTGSGVFSISLSGLTHSSNYRVRAYARNSEGITYSNEMTFITKVALPVITTTNITSITSNSVSSGGNVSAGTNITVISRGVCWSLNPKPTINSNKTLNGSGTGTFTSNVSSLVPNTKYYIRAYATVAGGVAYGNELFFTTLPLNETGNMTDARDGKAYKTVRIGNQWWMAENLNYNSFGGSWYYDNDSSNFFQDGRLYKWQNALNSCPSGWHLPTDNEWKTMEITLGISASDAEITGWRGTNQALSLFTGGPIGFNIRFAGQYYPYGAFGDHGAIATFWTSSGHDTENAWYRGFNLNHGDIHRYPYSKDYGYSVRCLKNTTAVVLLDSIGQISENSGTAYIIITYDGGANITERGVCWSTSENPIRTGNHISSGSGTGSLIIPISSLQHSTKYYVRAYALNSLGTSYSSQISFTTKVALPNVTSTSISSISSNTATSGGNVTGSGITVTGRGICWSTSPLPTIDNSKTSNGSGTGLFTSNITGLNPNTKYYVRAYATVSGGVAYGNELIFNTLPVNQTGAITDSRDGKTYKTIQMGTQWWMAENLKYSSVNSWFYQNDSITYSVYGKLYNYESAQNACPLGWHIPSNTEWKILEYNIGITDTASTSEWHGTNEAYKLFLGGSMGFNIIFGGQYTNGFYNSEATIAGFWTSTQTVTSNAWYRGFNIERGDIHHYSFSKDSRFSVRCIKHQNPSITTGTISDVTDSSVTCGGNITYNGGAAITARGICIGTAANPTILNDTTNNGTGSGLFTSYKKGLNPNTQYYVRAYATNSEGTSYGLSVPFKTAIAKPKVTTTLVNAGSINDSTAISGGNVTANGGVTLTARGVCWDTLPGPTVLLITKTNDGTATGTFSSNLTNLLPDKNYYYRAYATNSEGTSYGAEYNFTTLVGYPKVTTSAVTSITETTATGGGNVTASGGAVVTARGICWSLNQNPTTSDSLLPLSLQSSQSGAAPRRLLAWEMATLPATLTGPPSPASHCRPSTSERRTSRVETAMKRPRAIT
ncbi:MAG: FISUMP domain-containing protein [Bacteroidales bacterium]